MGRPRLGDGPLPYWPDEADLRDMLIARQMEGDEFKPYRWARLDAIEYRNRFNHQGDPMTYIKRIVRKYYSLLDDARSNLARRKVGFCRDISDDDAWHAWYDKFEAAKATFTDEEILQAAKRILD